MSAAHDPHDGQADRIGIVASTICAVHCLLGAVLAGASSLGVFLREAWTEFALLGTALVVAVWALVRGYRRHQRRLPLFLFCGALPVIAYARLVTFTSQWHEAGWSVLGASFLIAAHLVNLRLLARCDHRHCSHHQVRVL